MAASLALQATMKKQGENSGSCFEENRLLYQSYKTFYNFQKALL
jgi:hypothetical protein